MTINSEFTEYEFTIGNHTEQAHDYTSDLIDEAYRRKGADNPTTHLERVREADSLCEAHYAIIGDFPAESVLSRLAWYIVFDEMTDSHPDKMTREEYPIMSESQEDERFDKYRLNSDLQYGDRQFSGRKKTYYTDDSGAPQVRNNRMADPYDPTIEATGEYIDLYDALDNAGLTDRQRQAIDLVYFKDMTQEQAASVICVGQDVISRHLKAGLRKLREYMTKS